jgi:phosphotransferase system HPr-like phosphotransfer protein
MDITPLPDKELPSKNLGIMRLFLAWIVGFLIWILMANIGPSLHLHQRLVAASVAILIVDTIVVVRIGLSVYVGRLDGGLSKRANIRLVRWTIAIIALGALLSSLESVLAWSFGGLSESTREILSGNLFLGSIIMIVLISAQNPTADESQLIRWIRKMDLNPPSDETGADSLTFEEPLEKEFKLPGRLSLRAIGALKRCAKKFTAKVTMMYEGEKADVKSAAELAMLSQTVRLKAAKDDAERARVFHHAEEILAKFGHTDSLNIPAGSRVKILIYGSDGATAMQEIERVFRDLSAWPA